MNFLSLISPRIGADSDSVLIQNELRRVRRQRLRDAAKLDRTVGAALSEECLEKLQKQNPSAA